MLDWVRPTPKVLALHAHDFEGMFEDLRELADAVGADAGPLETELRRRIAAVAGKARGLPRRRVFCMEWFDPIYTTGHWVPEMVEMAGGRDALARAGAKSRRIEWAELAEYGPEALILMPCGLTMAKARKELPAAARRAEWKSLPAVRSGNVFLTDGPSYFNGAGPRLVRGLEILAEILHPEKFRRTGKGYARIGRGP